MVTRLRKISHTSQFRQCFDSILCKKYSTLTVAPGKDYKNLAAFHKKLTGSKRILALCGAGLSASSGLPTFRGAGGLWRTRNATEIATPEAFETDPGLVWLFYAYRRHMALKATPNLGHFALTALAENLPGFLCLTQNVDNLSIRAAHPPSQLRPLHGSLFNIKCSNPHCSYTEKNNTSDPLHPSLALAALDPAEDEPHPLLDPSHALEHMPAADLPACPECKALLRPDVVWYGEPLDEDMLTSVDEWIDDAQVDLVLVIGTSAVVWPAAGYIERARGRKTSVVTINPEAEKPDNLRKMRKRDFAFVGDAAVLLPQLLEPIIGKPGKNGTYKSKLTSTPNVGC
ncbi:DHS-like NAD/FAD-binding domain-containing protein [Lasiosphaeris hirsuta]|uniref:DHS-like NAD/FAD-binding domain-containing protein n=1 Tax=Lasiosphaeris hirsuta TaxID=260670 RepID=A0AA40A1F4_9PEZI|nr:DHS-like NAD/FAD-binding domain-containing protein [Lasiosphaeris hirsuta]